MAASSPTAPERTPESTPEAAPESAPTLPSGPSLFGDTPAIRTPRTRRNDPSNMTVVEEEDVLVLEVDEEEAHGEASEEMMQLQHVWLTIVDEVMASEKQLGSFLRHARLTALEGKTLLVSVPDDFHAKALRSERAKLAHRLSEGSGLHVERIGFRVESSSEGEIEGTDEEVNARETLEMLCEENPAVRALVERFGGEIVW